MLKKLSANTVWLSCFGKVGQRFATTSPLSPKVELLLLEQPWYTSKSQSNPLILLCSQILKPHLWCLLGRYWWRKLLPLNGIIISSTELNSSRDTFRMFCRRFSSHGLIFHNLLFSFVFPERLSTTWIVRMSVLNQLLEYWWNPSVTVVFLPERSLIEHFFKTHTKITTNKFF